MSSILSSVMLNVDTSDCVMICQVKGVRNLEKFLRGTAGGHLYDFWLDCERFKDQMVELDENDHMAMRNTLFR